MLHEITLENFKSHKKSTVSLKQYSIFIGPNNSGKSAVMQAMHLLKQGLNVNSEFDSDHYLLHDYQNSTPPHFTLDIGKYEDLLHKKAMPLSIGFKATLEGLDRSYLHFVADKKVQLGISYAFNNNKVFNHSGYVKLSSNEMSWPNTDEGKESLFKLNLNEHVSADYRPQFRITTPFEFRHTNKSPFAAISPSLENSLRAAYTDFQSLFKDCFGTFYFVSAIRGLEQYHIEKANWSPVQQEYLILPDRIKALHSALVYNRDLEEHVNDWLKKHFRNFKGLKLVAEIRDDDRIIVRVKHTHRTNPFIGEGLGLQQLLFMFIPIAIGNYKSIFIEEPEAHLHPKMQAELVEHFFNIGKNENRQFIMTTHSEHILFRFLTAVAKGEIKEDDLAIHYFDLNEEGVTKIDKVEFNKKGMVKGGLPGFFDATLAEVKDYLNIP